MTFLCGSRDSSSWISLRIISFCPRVAMEKSSSFMQHWKPSTYATCTLVPLPMLTFEMVSPIMTFSHRTIVVRTFSFSFSFLLDSFFLPGKKDMRFANTGCTVGTDMTNVDPEPLLPSSFFAIRDSAWLCCELRFDLSFLWDLVDRDLPRSSLAGSFATAFFIRCPLGSGTASDDRSSSSADSSAGSSPTAPPGCGSGCSPSLTSGGAVLRCIARSSSPLASDAELTLALADPTERASVDPDRSLGSSATVTCRPSWLVPVCDRPRFTGKSAIGNIFFRGSAGDAPREVDSESDEGTGEEETGTGEEETGTGDAIPEYGVGELIPENVVGEDVVERRGGSNSGAGSRK
mmetsp:Transcript_1738/g.4732  ORF Transcript_1738/g.4732 Transcript_1738/m.4732 type:complete len:348 (-) Transcript_1738:376-1419(-)